MDDADLAGLLVREAGTLAARMRREGLEAPGGLETEQKSHVSDIVTAADKAAEAHVVETLRRRRPDDSVVGEEGTDVAGASGRAWVIDPVDGTYNFHRGLDWWCSALALVDGEDLVLGAVHHPALAETFTGGPGLPTTCNGTPLAPLEDRPLAESCATTYLHPPFYDGEVGAAFQRAVSGVATLRMMGSGTMDAVAIARGRCDVLFQHSVPDWDRLPGEALIRGVGGDSRVVRAGGVDWYVAGVPTAVAEVCAALSAG
ncbi:inositol monophosphatase family protein [Nocardioides sp. Soil805]|uniref:inositol monophosphatase family protein n=1 Tax=Nocardioides sp. Soil805 TaxID=1736416 RepID=UPI0007039928|nr:inositol monophosphatase [Nocardioides sp. Soil805]KRF36180.1 fructose 1,6-bisphosphatase [Nocardioides sp. Soil805]